MKEDSADAIDLPAFHPCIVESDELGMAKNAKGFWVTELMNETLVEKHHALCE
jgi:hypothetical protein